MSIPNTHIEIKHIEPETVAYGGEGEIVYKSYISKYFWVIIGLLVVLLIWGTMSLINQKKSNVTIEYDPNLTSNK